MKNQIKISAAGNIEPPLYKIISDKGYQIEINNKLWIAKKSNLEFRGESIIELAGIILMYDTKGTNWKVSDSVIENYLEFLRINEK